MKKKVLNMDLVESMDSISYDDGTIMNRFHLKNGTMYVADMILAIKENDYHLQISQESLKYSLYENECLLIVQKRNKALSNILNKQ